MQSNSQGANFFVEMRTWLRPVCILLGVSFVYSVPVGEFFSTKDLEIKASGTVYLFFFKAQVSIQFNFGGVDSDDFRWSSTDDFFWSDEYEEARYELFVPKTIPATDITPMISNAVEFVSSSRQDSGNPSPNHFSQPYSTNANADDDNDDNDDDDDSDDWY